MSELMEVGRIRPGMVVELPPEVLKQAAGMKLGIFAEAVVAPTDKVHPYLKTIIDGQLVSFGPKAVELDTKWAVHTKVPLLKQIREGVRTGKLKVPVQGIISGSDPEIFVLDAKGDVLPAWKFLSDKATASKLMPPDPFWDGFQAEFCPMHRTCLQQHMDHMQELLKRLLVLAQNHDPKARLTIQSTVQVSDKVMKSASDEEVRFRCTPSLNVYRDAGEPQPDAREYKYRFAGGHLHAGFGSKKFTTPVVSEIVRALDGILGLAGVSLAANFDNPERRKMYGRAGEFRLPKHGIEYRVLSNFWLCHPALAHLVFELFRGAIAFAEAGLYSICWERPSDEEIREIINNCDVVRARKILGANQPCVEAILRTKLYEGREYLGERRMGADVLPRAIHAILNGLEVAIKEPENVHKNWHLDDGVPWVQLCSNKGASWASL